MRKNGTAIDTAIDDTAIDDTDYMGFDSITFEKQG